MNENTTPKRVSRFKPNIIDFLIVIAVIGAVVGIAFRMGMVDKIVKQNNATAARITFLVENINYDSYNYFEEGDAFTDKTHGCYLGSFEKKISVLPAKSYMEDANGVLIEADSPASPSNPDREYRIDLRGTILASGVFSDEGFLLDGTTYLAPNSKIIIESKNVTVSVTVMEIERIESAQ